MATKLNLGTNIWADEASNNWASGIFNDTYLTGGQAGVSNRLINVYSQITGILHSDLLEKFDSAGLMITNISSNKVAPSHDGVISNMKYNDDNHVYVVAIAVGSGVSINTHDMSGKAERAQTDFSGAELVHYTESSDDADVLANFLKNSQVAVAETYTNCGVIFDACTPVSQTNTSGSDGWVLYVGFTAFTEAGLQTALADYIIT